MVQPLEPNDLTYRSTLLGPKGAAGGRVWDLHRPGSTIAEER